MEHFPKSTVYGFEPNPDYRNVLEDLSRQQENFCPQFMGLGNKDCRAVLNIAASRGNTSL